MAIDTAVAISYKAPGVALSNFLGLAKELAIPIERIMAANLKPSTRAAWMERKETEPSRCNELPSPRSIDMEGSIRKTSCVASARLKMTLKITLSKTTIAPRKR
jgi:hypothetical protein